MFLTHIAARNPHVFRMIHIWTRAQQHRFYGAISDAAPGLI